MSKIEQLRQGDLEALLSLLDLSFTGDSASGHFEKGLPKMWIDDDAHMKKHHVIREDGNLLASVGIYPFDIEISGEKFRFATVGNMATAPDARGRGFMSELYAHANRVLSETGVDVARLGGKRSRYERFGYEPCGFKFRFNLTLQNAIEYFRSRSVEEPEIKIISPDDEDSLNEIRRLYMKGGIVAERGDRRDFYLSLLYFGNVPYGAYLGGKLVGYFTIAENSVCEAAAVSPEILSTMLSCAAIKFDKDISVSLPPDSPAELKALSTFCEGMTTEIPSHYKILSWDKLTRAMLKLRAERIAPLCDGELILEIRNHYSLLIKVRDGVGTCEKTDKTPDISLSDLSAARFLFGPLPPYTAAELPPEKAAFITSNLPFPFYTHAHDKA